MTYKMCGMRMELFGKYADKNGDIKGIVLFSKVKNGSYEFNIGKNDIPNVFTLIGTDIRGSVRHIWTVGRNELINGVKMCNYNKLIINKKRFVELEKYLVKESDYRERDVDERTLREMLEGNDLRMYG